MTRLFARLEERVRHPRRGVQSIQLLFVIPLLLALLYAIIEFGLLLQIENTITTAAQEGVRVAARGGTTTDVLTAINNTLALHQMLIDASTTDADVRIETSGMSDVTINGSLPASGSGPPLALSPTETRVTIEVLLRPSGASSVWQSQTLPDLLVTWGFTLVGRSFTASSMAPVE